MRSNTFLHWVGSKSYLVKTLLKNLPKEFNNYYEVFLGSGALFFALNPKKAYLSDINNELITTYKVVRDNIDELMAQLRIYKSNHNKEHYYKIRSLDNIKDDIIIASRLIYLNKTCFKGLYRVNSNGKFNVPIGCEDKLKIEPLKNSSEALKGVEIQSKQFYDIDPQSGDFIYLDPPYDNTYNQYTINKFSQCNQKRLAEFCKILDKKGCYFLLSNSNTEFIRNLYKDFIIIEIYNNRSINGHKKVKELLIKNY